MQALVCAVPILLLNNSLAYAQSTPPSRITPRRILPDDTLTSREIILPATVSAAMPENADKLSVQIADISVEGNRINFTNIINDIIVPLKGRQVKVSELYEAAAAIEAAYVRAGYVLTRATVPPQQLGSGAIFKIMIVDGFIESIDDSAVPDAVRSVVQARTQSLIGEHGLTLAQIERRLLLAGDTPGIALKSTLVPGTAVGGVKLVLEATHKRLSAQITFDNNLNSASRNIAFSSRVALNSLLGHGELIYALAITGPDVGKLVKSNPTRRVLGVGVVVPIWHDGLSLNVEYIRSDTNPKTPAGGLATTGVYERAVVRASYPLIRSRAQTLALKGSIELVNERQSAPAFNAQISADKLRYVTTGLEWTRNLNRKITVSADFMFTQGLSGLGARSLVDVQISRVPSSRQGSKPNFSKIDGYVHSTYALPQNMQANVTLRGQATLNGALPSSAQFSLDAKNGLSGLALGSLNVDSGMTVRTELERFILFKLPEYNIQLMPYLFGAYGKGTVDQPTALELPTLSGWSAGGGLRAALGSKNGYGVSIGLEVARTHSNTLAADQTRTSATISSGF